MCHVPRFPPSLGILPPCVLLFACSGSAQGVAVLGCRQFGLRFRGSHFGSFCARRRPVLVCRLVRSPVVSVHLHLYAVLQLCVGLICVCFLRDHQVDKFAIPYEVSHVYATPTVFFSLVVLHLCD